MIAIQIVDEKLGVLHEFSDPSVADAPLAPLDGNTVCLRFIDPYGDTIFNRLQTETLVAELAEVARQQTDAPRRARIEALVTFVRPVLDEPHLYVRFFGE